MEMWNGFRGMTICRVAPFAFALLLAACGSDPAPAVTDRDGPDVPAVREPAPLVTSTSIAGAGGQRFDLLDHAEISSVIEPGLGCAFTLAGGASPLLVAAAGNPAGVVKLNGTLVRLEADRPVHDYIEAGPVLRSEALEVSIRRETGEGRQTGIETVAWPAEMIVAQDESGEILRRNGEWSCGA